MMCRSLLPLLAASFLASSSGAYQPVVLSRRHAVVRLIGSAGPRTKAGGLPLRPRSIRLDDAAISSYERDGGDTFDAGAGADDGVEEKLQQSSSSLPSTQLPPAASFSGGGELGSMTRTLLLMNEEMKEAGGKGFSDTQLEIIQNFLATYYIPKLNFSKGKKTSLMWAFRLSESSKVIMGALTVLISGLLQRGDVPLLADDGGSSSSFLGEYGLLSITVLGGLQTLIVSFGTLFQPRERAMMHLLATSELETAWNSFIWGAGGGVQGVVYQEGRTTSSTTTTVKYNFWGSSDPNKRNSPWTAFQAFTAACISAASMSTKAQMEALDEDEER